jgi:predicted phosphodiesterase
MRLHILSDLHLEASRFNRSETDADVIVLAGDIWKGANGVRWASMAWPGRPVVYVPGNHEFYGRQRKEVLSEMRIEASKAGVHLLDNDEVIIDGPEDEDSVRFLGATLWTDFELDGAEAKPWAMHEGGRALNDFRMIREGVDGHFSPQRSIELHRESLAWLEQKLAEPFKDGKTVVVSHHLPSMLSVAERFKTDLLSACFASNLDRLFGKMDLWAHGHTHDSFDYVSGGTRVVCNPRGYEVFNRGPENCAFEPKMVVEV